MLKSYVVRGMAFFQGDGLRCRGPRPGNPKLPCNKLLAKINSLGQVAGKFLCERCKQSIEIEVR